MEVQVNQRRRTLTNDSQEKEKLWQKLKWLLNMFEKRSLVIHNYFGTTYYACMGGSYVRIG